MIYALETKYDSRESFYGKAQVMVTKNKNVEDLKLFSYDTDVARIIKIGNMISYHCYDKYSSTTTRHQKEFFKQNGLNDEEIKELFKNKALVKELL